MLLTASAGQAGATAHTVSAWSLLAQLVIGLAVILLIIFGTTRFLGGKGRRTIGAGRRGMLFSVLARQSMGKGVSIVIVRAGTATYLLGVTPNQVTRLDQLDPESLVPESADPDDPEQLGDGGTRPAPGWGSFVRALQDRSVRR